MDPDAIDALVKAAPAIAKGAAAVGAAIPFTAIVKRMLGPAADELAEMWRDQVRMYRYERQLSCVKKAERMAEEAGFTPKAVPPKILFPLLEGASFEDNEDLHTMWAALLANGACPGQRHLVRPTFIAILKQMSSDEAEFLNRIWHRLEEDPYERIQRHWNTSEIPIGSCLDGLLAEQLIRSIGLSDLNEDRDVHQEILTVDVGTDRYRLTDRGREFIQACNPPKPKKNGLPLSSTTLRRYPVTFKTHEQSGVRERSSSKIGLVWP